MLRQNPSYAYRHWQVNWTLRSVGATAVFAAGALASAYGATLSLDQARRAEYTARAEASELQLLTEYAAFMTAETAAIRRDHQGNSVRTRKAERKSALHTKSGLNDLISIELTDLKQAREAAIERRCLAEAIYFEARSEKRVGQLAVADVILNRVNSSIYPNSICDVVYQGSERVTGCQFSFTCDGSMDNARLTQNNKRWRDSQDMAGSIIAGLHKPVSRYATHYHADYVDPPWADNLAPTATIGTHKFYRFKNGKVSFAAPAGM